MMSFIEWIEFDRKKKEKELKGVGSNSQAGGKVGGQILQGETPRLNQEVELERVSYFSEPRK